ncbi:MAG TPA: ATP-binding protein, partial [Geobacterales bacterium]|nr:ATP-binding protein [Geobacterales bacterium]
VGDLKGREFGQLADSMNVIGESMQRRQEDLRNNFRALEEAHGYLSDSYQRLEHLSGELERSEGLYRSLLKFSGDAIVVMDHSGEIRMANIRAEQLFGYPASRLIGLTYDRLRQLLHMTGEGGGEFFTEVLHAGSGECDVEFLTGERGTAARLFGTLITSGDERLIQVIIHETTREREVLQNLERNASELARLNKMKDSFLGLASHELKTPLTVIMGYAELITTSMADSVNPSVLSMVENISNAANRLDSIVRDMVDVSMIEEKKLQLKQEEMDMNELIRATERELSFFFTLRKQRLHLELDETIPLIRGDSVRIMQLLANIIGNAIKFTPDGGTITVSTRLTYTPDNRRRSLLTAAGLHKLFVETIVSDTGIGIDTEDHLRIFDKFYEVGNIDEHSSGKVAFKGKGVGLGLAIAKGIVDMHGGLIWVESTGYDPDLFPGSTFHILLPVTTLVSDVTIDYLASVTAGDEKRPL